MLTIQKKQAKYFAEKKRPWNRALRIGELGLGSRPGGIGKWGKQGVSKQVVGQAGSKQTGSGATGSCWEWGNGGMG